MSIRDWQVTCEAIVVDGALPMEFSVAEGVDGEWSLRVAMAVPDVRNEENPLVISHNVPIDVEADEATRIALIRERVHYMYRHEADERISVHGVRLFRPFHEH